MKLSITKLVLRNIYLGKEYFFRFQEICQIKYFLETTNFFVKKYFYSDFLKQLSFYMEQTDHHSHA